MSDTPPRPADSDPLVCLPTFNEAQNLPVVIARIREHLPRARILVVDDNSPDGTGAVADGLARTDARVSVLHRPTKEGLGQAYLAGFRHILDHDPPARIVQMDADLSHPPARLPALLQAAEEADLVIGSRYVADGGTANWSLLRRMVSRFGSLYARTWLGLPVQDLTGGFKVWRRELLDGVMAQAIDSGGYVFQIEMTYRAAQRGARIIEVPILFTDRDVGASKMTLGIALEAFWRVPLLRFSPSEHP